jgi:hypothetical protein
MVHSNHIVSPEQNDVFDVVCAYQQEQEKHRKLGYSLTEKIIKLRSKISEKHVFLFSDTMKTRIAFITQNPCNGHSISTKIS